MTTTASNCSSGCADAAADPLDAETCGTPDAAEVGAGTDGAVGFGAAAHGGSVTVVTVVFCGATGADGTLLAAGAALAAPRAVRGAGLVRATAGCAALPAAVLTAALPRLETVHAGITGAGTGIVSLRGETWGATGAAVPALPREEAIKAGIDEAVAGAALLLWARDETSRCNVQ